MATQVNVPGIGKVEQKWVWAGGAVIVGIVAYAWWSQNSAPTEEAPTTADYTTDEYSGLDYAVEDYGYSGSVPGYVSPGGTDYPDYVDQNPLPSTNAEWSLVALDALEGVGISRGAASAAIGKYLARMPVSSIEADYIRQANAMVGSPPVGEYTIIVETAPPTQPPPSDGNNDTVELKAPTGLGYWGNGPSRLTVPLKWNPVPGAVQGYRVYRSDLAYNIGASQDTQITIPGLQPNKSYKFRVRAVGAGGKLGPPSAWFTAKTKK